MIGIICIEYIYLSEGLTTRWQRVLMNSKTRHDHVMSVCMDHTLLTTQ
jgi:hypothetical protein